MILEKNRTTKKLKGRMTSNGEQTREWLSREDTSSTTASLEAFFLMAKIDAYKG